MFSSTVTVLGEDLRQFYLAEYLAEQEYKLQYLARPTSETLKEACDCSSVLIGPTPFMKDSEQLDLLLHCLKPGQLLAGGGIPEPFVTACKERNVSTIDFLKDPRLSLENAALTAEGLLSILVKETPFSLVGRKALLLGFGRCGQEIGKRLLAFEMDVLVLDQDEDLFAVAQKMGLSPLSLRELERLSWDFDLIINSVPAPVLTVTQLKLLSNDCVLFDIASFPYGFDPAVIQELNLKLVNCPGIPGRYMPKTAGELLGRAMIERMKQTHGF